MTAARLPGAVPHCQIHVPDDVVDTDEDRGCGDDDLGN